MVGSYYSIFFLFQLIIHSIRTFLKIFYEKSKLKTKADLGQLVYFHSQRSFYTDVLVQLDGRSINHVLTGAL